VAGIASGVLLASAYDLSLRSTAARAEYAARWGSEGNSPAALARLDLASSLQESATRQRNLAVGGLVVTGALVGTAVWLLLDQEPSVSSSRPILALGPGLAGAGTSTLGLAVAGRW